MTTFKLVTPVAFIIFNRPDTAARVFAEIAKARPAKLLVIGDGPRTNRMGEAERVEATRAIIKQVDWECEVLTNFSEVNLGCKKRVASGIDWVFEQVEEAIILEDDCLPDPTFFRYCQEMLALYSEEKRVGIISGDNFQFGRKYGEDSYYFSKYVHIWGWATWRDRWAGSYDVAISSWPRVRDEGRLIDLVGNADEAKYWSKIFERVFRGEIDTWDYQWLFANWLQGRLNIMPRVNLISNIGFGSGATHTTGGGELANMTVESMSFPLLHPLAIVRSIRADSYSDRKCFRRPLWKRILGRIVVLFDSITKYLAGH